MQKLWDALNAIYNFIIGFPEWLLDLIVNVFVSLLTLIKDAFLWIFEQLLSLASSALASLDLSGITDSIGIYGNLPAEIINILALCRVGEAIGIIVVALGIRFLLQLIPFVRLGS